MKIAFLYFTWMYPLVLSTTCNFNNIHSDSKFDIQKGIWYELERTTFQWGPNGTWHSSIWNWYHGGDGHMYMAYGGFSRHSKSCSAANSGMLTGSAGKYILTAENRYEAALQVVYTDYNIALVYMCYAVETNGECQKNKVHVSLLGRHSHLTASQRNVLISRLDSVCVHHYDLIVSDLGLCVAPTADPIHFG